MKFFLYLITLITIVIHTGCTHNEEDLPIHMNDGFTFKLSSLESIFYKSKESFVSDCPSFWTCNYSFLSHIDEQFVIDNTYSISGYDDQFIMKWEKARFGNWIREYGLNPNEEYYCAWIKYVIYLPHNVNSYYTPVKPLNNMGFISNTDRPGFDAEYRKGYPKEVIYTFVRYIGYDINKNGIYKEIPNLNIIIWNFTIKNK